MHIIGDTIVRTLYIIWGNFQNHIPNDRNTDMMRTNRETGELGNWRSQGWEKYRVVVLVLKVVTNAVLRTVQLIRLKFIEQEVDKKDIKVK